jgi:hypothetical protein
MKTRKPVQSHALLGMAEDIVKRLEAEQLAMQQNLSAILKTPLGNISSKAGEMERDSPLFFGTGTNRSLF